jgi:hypothetical protein
MDTTVMKIVKVQWVKFQIDLIAATEKYNSTKFILSKFGTWLSKEKEIILLLSKI